MSKTSGSIFGAGLGVATAIRATEAFRPANERIFDARCPGCLALTQKISRVGYPVGDLS
ncbi:MAG: hypothetical protein IMY85_02780 [Chloroflexi bacterium]|nr:hypothetical protein [Chloroflexota bacterium]